VDDSKITTTSYIYDITFIQDTEWTPDVNNVHVDGIPFLPAFGQIPSLDVDDSMLQGYKITCSVTTKSSGMVTADILNLVVTDIGTASVAQKSVPIYVLPTIDLPEVLYAGKNIIPEDESFFLGSSLSLELHGGLITDSETYNISIVTGNANISMIQSTSNVSGVYYSNHSSGDCPVILSTLVLRGNPSALKLALANLLYTPTDNFCGMTSIQFHVKSGKTALFTETIVRINIECSLDAPILNITRSQFTVPLQVPSPIFGISIIDPDSCWYSQKLQPLKIKLETQNGLILIPVLSELSPGEFIPSSWNIKKKVQLSGNVNMINNV
jgi:hypothetical protein